MAGRWPPHSNRAVAVGIGKGGSSARVVEAISEGLLSGRYVPGQRLIEADLTRELGVSRGPVREALKRLAGEGMLTITRHRGAFVRAQSRQDVQDTMRVVESLTGLAARQAAENIEQSGGQAKLEQARDKLMALRGQGESLQYFAARRHFYDTIIAIGGNRELARLMPQMQINLLRLQFQPYITERQRARHFKEYELIANAVLAGNATKAERETQMHLHRRRQHLATLPDSAFAAASPEGTTGV